MLKREPHEKVFVRTRLPEPLRAALEAEAHSRGSSVNNEIVRRLERSFAQEWYDGLIGGPMTAVITQVIARVFHEVGTAAGFLAKRTTGENWLANAYAFDQAVKGVVAALETLRPAGERTARQFRITSDPEMEAGLNYANEHIGEGMARMIMNAIGGERITGRLYKSSDQKESK